MRLTRESHLSPIELPFVWAAGFSVVRYFSGPRCAPFSLGCGYAGHNRLGSPNTTIKATFLYDFAKFVDWPANNTVSSEQIPVYALHRGRRSIRERSTASSEANESINMKS